MKTSKVGIVAVAILLVVTGVGFGIAQAGGTHTDRPVLSFMNQEAVQQGSSSSLESPIETGSLSAEVSDFDPFSRSEDMQLESPVETGAIPATDYAESWMKEYGHD
jgi:hypothetical protein